MFSFCCPNKKNKTAVHEIDQKLIQAVNSPKKNNTQNKGIALSESDRKKQSSNMSEKSLPLSNLQKTSFNHTNKLHSSLHSQDKTVIGVEPYFDGQTMTPTAIGLRSKINSKNKGQLFEFDHNTQIIYFDTKKGEEFCLRFLITKKPITQKQTKSILNFILGKNQQNPDEQQELILVIPSKMMYESKHMQIPSNVHAIFTNMRRPNRNNEGHIIEIVDGNHRSIKTQNFDKIIIILEGEHDVNYIKNYCQQLAKMYSIQEFLKIWWVFPSFVGLQDICQIIKQTLRKFVINQPIQSAAKYLYYEVDAIKQLNVEPFILVRNKRWRDFQIKKERLQSKDYETQICLAIGLFMIEMNETVLPYYKYLLQNFLFSMKLVQYLKYKQLLQNQKQNFFKKLIFYNLITEDGAKILEQNRKMIEHKYENPQHRRFAIKYSARRKFISAFGFQQSIQTGQGITPVRLDWDDDLKLEDLQIRKGSWDKDNQTIGNDLNLIDEEDIDQIMLKNNDKFVYQDNQPSKDPILAAEKQLAEKYDQREEQINIRIEESC